jgi:urease accessory protein
MQTRSVVEVGGGGVLRRLDTRPPLTIRRVHGADGECALCLVGTAAGPLAGDDLALDLVIDAGARASLCATGASVAQGRDHVGARMATTARLGEGACLDADPGPLIVCAGAAVDVDLAIDLASDATLRWDEVLVLGRTGEPATGAVRLRWNVTRGGAALLRQDVDLADPDLREWLGMTAGRRVLASTLLVGPDMAGQTVVHGPYAAAQPLAADAVLVTVLGSGAAEAMQQRDTLIAESRRRLRTLR